MRRIGRKRWSINGRSLLEGEVMETEGKQRELLPGPLGPSGSLSGAIVGRMSTHHDAERWEGRWRLRCTLSLYTTGTLVEYFNPKQLSGFRAAAAI